MFTYPSTRNKKQGRSPKDEAQATSELYSEFPLTNIETAAYNEESEITRYERNTETFVQHSEPTNRKRANFGAYKQPKRQEGYETDNLYDGELQARHAHFNKGNHLQSDHYHEKSRKVMCNGKVNQLTGVKRPANRSTRQHG